ncbi:UDP-galactopyranose mutase [Paenibacillus sp. SI8]|uniref:UDP-galactopyranose mutase n=1 Tax=unclassified Paenibacillus TaxID=185978 RepID=UPI0034660522
MKYDYLIAGSGLYGSIFAYEAKKRGKKCLVIEKRDHVGGNIYTENQYDINVHKYGAHIFHTHNKEIWDYINQFAEFNHFILSPVANYKGEIYNLPFNMNTFSRLWNIATPKEAQDIIAEQSKKFYTEEPQNIEEQAINSVGTDIYEKLIKSYVEKQWGRKCTDLPAFIIKRLPLRFTYDNNYFNDRYQGIPIGGYTNIINKMLDGIDVETNVDFFQKYKDFSKYANKLVFTGMIDEYYGYKYGALEYRSLKFENEVLGIENYQGNAVVSFTDSDTKHTRIIEHKHFEFGKQKNTVITKEYPKEWEVGEEAYYPINDDKNNSLFKKYLKLAENDKNILFGGRLGTYKYLDMDKVIAAVLLDVKREFLK